MADCPMCQGVLPSGKGICEGGARTEESFCRFCSGVWTVKTSVYPSETLGVFYIEPADELTTQRYEAYKKGRAIEAARNARRLIRLGMAVGPNRGGC